MAQGFGRNDIRFRFESCVLRKREVAFHRDSNLILKGVCHVERKLV